MNTEAFIGERGELVEDLVFIGVIIGRAKFVLFNK